MQYTHTTYDLKYLYFLAPDKPYNVTYKGDNAHFHRGYVDNSINTKNGHINNSYLPCTKKDHI